MATAPVARDELAAELSLAARVSGAGIVRLRRGRSGWLLRCDTRSRAILGLPEGSLALCSAWRRIHPADRRRIHLQLSDASPRLELDFELRFTRPDGEPLFLSCRAAAMDERPDDILLGIIDHSHQHELAAQFERRHLRTELALELSGLGTYAWHPEQQRLEVDDRFAGALGLVRGGSYTLGELLPSIHSDDRAQFQAAICGPHTRSKPFSFRCAQDDGSVTFLECRGQTVTLPGTGEIVVGAVRDITQLNAQREQLWLAHQKAETAVAARGRFLSNMSHELRTPITAILGFSQMLRAHSRDRPADLELIDLIETSGQDLLRLVNDVLQITATAPAAEPDETAEYKPAAVLAKAADGMRGPARLKGLEWRVEMDDLKDLTLRGEPEPLDRIIRTLLSNAIKFTPRGHVSLHATLSPAKTGSHLVLQVSDSGIGIAADQLEHVFEEFWQGNDRQPGVGGPGLGLAVCRRKVESLGGTIAVESSPGRGTTFTVRIPVALSQTSSGFTSVDCTEAQVNEAEAARQRPFIPDPIVTEMLGAAIRADLIELERLVGELKTLAPGAHSYLNERLQRLDYGSILRYLSDGEQPGV